MKTKARILEAARELLNQKGYGNTTIRHIAASIGISHGNLGYHFKNLDEIVKTLYYQLVSEMDQVMSKVPYQASHLGMLYQQSRYVFQQFDRNKFFFIDFVAICRGIPEIRQHYLELQHVRNKQSLAIMHLMIEEGLLEARFSDAQLQQLIRQSTIQADFWLSSAEIHYDGPEAQKLDHYTRLLIDLWFPYLTVKGREAYDQLFSK